MGRSMRIPMKTISSLTFLSLLLHPVLLCMKKIKLATSFAIWGVEAGVPSSYSIIPSLSCLDIPMIMWSKYLTLWDELRVEVFSFRDFQTIWWLEVIASQDVIDIVDSSGSKSDFGEISGPDTTVSIFGLILWKVRCIDVIMNVSILFIIYLSL